MECCGHISVRASVLSRGFVSSDCKYMISWLTCGNIKMTSILTRIVHQSASAHPAKKYREQSEYAEGSRLGCFVIWLCRLLFDI